MPRRHRGRHYKMGRGVCPSVCGVPRHNSRTERYRKLKIYRMEAHQTGKQWTYLEAKRSKVNVARSRDPSDMLVDTSRKKKVLETPKLVGRLSTVRIIRLTSFKVKSQRSRSPGRLILRPEVCHIFRLGRPTNFKLGTHTQNHITDKRRDLQDQRSRSQGHVMRLTRVGRYVESVLM